MTLEFSAYVEEDVDHISAHIAKGSPASADRMLTQLKTELMRIAQFPLQFPQRPDIDGNARCAVIGDYLILFSFSEQRVRIERVVHGSRSLPSLFQNARRNG